MKILAIESSCDETAAAVVSDDGKVISNVVATQIEDHAAFGGVVPEIASRRHVELIGPVVAQALKEAGIDLDGIDGVAVTQGPGLVGALLVGISYAKALAYGLGVPLVGVNHLEGHLTAARIEHDFDYPYIGMVVSGGHTSIYLVESPSKVRQLGQTLDDAAGEAFDKVAKLLDLGYPGGVIIDRISKGVDHQEIELPRPMVNDDSYNFSFSGLKTAVLNHVMGLKIFPEMDLKFSGVPRAKTPAPGKAEYIPKIAAAFQAAAVDVIVHKLVRALQDHGMERLVISGGVACNSALRERLQEKSAELGFAFYAPSPRYCTDNAAMIGMASIRDFQEKNYAAPDMNAVSRWSVPS